MPADVDQALSSFPSNFYDQLVFSNAESTPTISTMIALLGPKI